MSLARLVQAAVLLVALGLLGAASPAPAAQSVPASYIAPRPMGPHHLTIGLHCETREIS